jgi:NADPH2:quinone reductase
MSARAVVVSQFGTPAALRVENVPARHPGAGEVLVRVRAAGVNPVDAYIASGNYARKPPLPYTPGWDGAGDVEAVGAGVSDVKPGDRVWIAGDNVSVNPGTFADYATLTKSQVHRLATPISHAQGAAVGVPYATAYRALFLRAAARPGEIVLVHGATGGVGIAAVQFAVAHGMKVIATGGSDRGLDIVRDQGAHVVLNHKTPGYLDDVKRAADGHGVDVVLEMAAHINLDNDLGLLAHGGRVVVIGNRGRVEIDARQAMVRDASIQGMLLFNTPPAELVSIHEAIEAGLENGTLNPVVGREFVLDNSQAALDAVLQPGALGKIVVVP